MHTIYVCILRNHNLIKFIHANSANMRIDTFYQFFFSYIFLDKTKREYIFVLNISLNFMCIMYHFQKNLHHFF